MTGNHQAPRRRNSLRYKGFDYRSVGAYFVTICTHRGRCLFGDIDDDTMRLNSLGLIADHAWRNFAANHPEIEVAAFVVMPNHVHVLLTFTADVAPPPGPVIREFGKPVAGALSTLMGAYKAEVTRQADAAGLRPQPKLWHRNFWDHIVRDERDFENDRNYIVTNPARWAADQLHPDAPPNRFNHALRAEQ